MTDFGPAPHPRGRAFVTLANQTGPVYHWQRPARAIALADYYRNTMPDFSTLFQLASAQPVATAALAIIAALLLAALLFRKLKPWQSYLRPQPILTANEREFFHRLTRALPHHHIFPQVAMSALITVDCQLSERHRFSIRRRFGFKYCDFVICQPFTLDVLLVIELDDRTHDAGSDRKRDSMTKAAGYQTLRFQSKQKPSVAELADLFSKLLPTLKK